MSSPIPGLDPVRIKPRHEYKEEVKENRLFGLKDVPTVYPSEEEFRTPVEYVSSLTSLGKQYGMVKIVPPASWNPKFALDIGKFTFECRKQKLSHLGAETRASHNWLDRMAKYHAAYRSTQPIDKYPVIGSKVVDLFSVSTLKMRGYSWMEIIHIMGFDGPVDVLVPRLIELYNELVIPFEDFVATQQRMRNYKRKMYSQDRSDYSSLSLHRYDPHEPPMGHHEESSERDQDSGYGQSDSDDDDAKCPECGLVVEEQTKYLECRDCKEYFHVQCTPPVLQPDRFSCPTCLMSNSGFYFAPGSNYNLAEFQDVADELREKYVQGNMSAIDAENLVEKKFWSLVKDIRSEVEVEYGADIRCDMKGSGFPTIAQQPYNKYSKDPWNLNNFPQMKASLFHHLKTDISGVTLPWAYVGMIFSAFCWHSEDHYTYSINYQHFGDTKTWYSIPGEYSEQFEKICKSLFPSEFKVQPELLYERATMVCPEIIRKCNIPVYVADQRPGQFIVTFPKVYHAGFNHGMNLNEAVNFAPPDWVSFGRQAVDVYRKERRAPVFSHDRLVLATSENDRSQHTAQWIIRYLREMMREAAARMGETIPKLETAISKNKSIKLKITNVRGDKGNEDLYACTSCKCLAYVSRVTVDADIYCHHCVPWHLLENGKHSVILDQRYTVKQLQELCKDVLERI